MTKINKFFTLCSVLFALCTIAPAYASDCSVDALDGKNYGCADSCGDIEVGNGYRIFLSYPQMSRCSTSWRNDKWNSPESYFCSGWGTVCRNLRNAVPIADKENRCWKCGCPEGTYFDATSGTTDYTKCIPCNGLQETKQGETCWKIQCPNDVVKGVLGKDIVIWNGNCVPICDLMTAGATYDSADKTKLTIKIKRTNAGTIGHQD